MNHKDLRNLNAQEFASENTMDKLTDDELDEVIGGNRSIGLEEFYKNHKRGDDGKWVRK